MADINPADVDRYLAESTAFAQEAERRVREHIDPYPFVLELLGHVFRGAAAAGAMGGDEPRAIGFLADTCGSIIADDDPASLPLFEKGSPA